MNSYLQYEQFEIQCIIIGIVQAFSVVYSLIRSYKKFEFTNLIIHTLVSFHCISEHSTNLDYINPLKITKEMGVLKSVKKTRLIVQVNGVVLPLEKSSNNLCDYMTNDFNT